MACFQNGKVGWHVGGYPEKVAWFWFGASMRENTKSGRKRIIPMNDAVIQVLWPLWQAQKSKFVFCEQEDSPIDAHHIYRVFRIAQEKAGFLNLIRFHDLRHTFASQFMMKGGSIYDLQKILGHSTIGMTERYAHRRTRRTPEPKNQNR